VAQCALDRKPCAEGSGDAILCIALALFRSVWPGTLLAVGRAWRRFMPIQTIVLAFDFCEPAARALRWADSMAQASGARLEIVHVYPDFESSGSVRAWEGPWPNADQVERYVRFLKQELRDIARDALGERGELAGLHVERGDPIKRLMTRADQLHADLIVVGATGKRTAERLFLGSVSEGILRASHVPVAIIR
jgi:nucleotide-binding universal stress UspA family protein